MASKARKLAAASALILSSVAMGCDSDDSDTSEQAASAAGAGGSSASAGKGGDKAEGGKTGSGRAGAGGAGGSAGKAGGSASQSEAGAEAEGGKGGSEADGGKGGAGGAGGSGGRASAAGSGGAAGAQPPRTPPTDISNVTAERFEQANGFSGLTFAPDGKIYAAGEINIIDESKATGDTAADKFRTSIAGHKVVIARFTPDGKPDTTFGEGGFATWQGPGADATALSLALTDDGSVVASVNLKYPSKRGGVALLKLDASGKPVTSFGDGGRKDLFFGWRDENLADYPKATDGAVQYPSAQSWDIQATDGGKKLVIFAHEPAARGLLDEGATPPVQRIDNDRYVLRVNAADGEPDASWNGGKPVVVNTPNNGATGMQPRYPSDGSRHGLVEADGSVVATGYTNYQDDKGNHIVLVRLKPDGSFDDAFHKERPNQPVLPGVAVYNPVPEQDKGFAECYGVARTAKGYVTTGYGRAFGAMEGKSSLDYLPSTAVDMVASRFTGTEVDSSFGRKGLFAAQSEVLGADVLASFEDRGRTTVVALSDQRTLMGGRFGDYPALFVVTEKGELDARVKGKREQANGVLLLPWLTSEKQPATSSVYGLAVSADGKRVAVSTNNHERGALLSVLEVKDDGTFAPVKAQ